MPSAMRRPPKEKASEMRKIHIPIFPGVAVPYWASGGHATVGWPCSEATALLKLHLPGELPRRRGFRYLSANGGRDSHRIASCFWRSIPRRAERRGCAAPHVDDRRRGHSRLADSLGAPHASA